MQTVTEFSRVNKNVQECVAELLTCLHINSINTPSFRSAMYGNYVTLWLELTMTGKLKHMEDLRRSRRRGRRGLVIQQSLKQYYTMSRLRSIIQPSRGFMRIVAVKDSYFDLDNSYTWVDLAFIRRAVCTLRQQINMINVCQDAMQFEHKVRGGRTTGICDMYDPRSKTVIEVKTCRFIAKESFAQVSAYAALMSCKRAYLINTVDGGVWRVIPSNTREGERWLKPGCLG